jgi:ribonucleoside-diphosphate reductase alpha chain
MKVAVANGHMSSWASHVYQEKYAHTKPSGHKETWPEVAARVVRHVVLPYLPELAPRIERLIVQRKFMPGGRYLYAAGRRYQQLNNCFLFRAEDSREGWGELQNKTANALMTGGGIGVVYSDLRGKDSPIEGMGGLSTGPVALAKIINEQGRYTRQGGSRRSAIWGGWPWWHPDVFDVIGAKDWDEWVREGKRRDYNRPAPLDMTNVSVILDDDFFAAYNTPGWSRSYRTGNSWHTVGHDWACDVYWTSVRGMLRTGEPGFSVDVGDNAGENLRNACTEVTSAYDCDMCNLASANLARMESPEEFAEVCELGTAFLLCGTLASKLPWEPMYRVREKTRRLGLGLMGLHEWLLLRGRVYGPDEELGRWLQYYRMSGAYADRWADRMGISRSVATRAVAPNGTIAIVAETTSSGEPVFATAYKRRYLKNEEWKWQYVVDPTAALLVARGVDPKDIEDSLALAEDVERRIAFQAWLQENVDHGISSTINLPPWGSPRNNESGVTRFGNTLLKYLPRLRGITAYPDGARDGQPLVKVPYEEAVAMAGVEFIDGGEANCKGGVCGS